MPLSAAFGFPIGWSIKRSVCLFILPIVIILTTKGKQFKNYRLLHKFVICVH
ncbi:hypothetical protein BD408DRAFT_414886 [Parasitella parasitica]|nr:hypothetical protein BD408DRAFT_414886 [Parasitella parasitica]